MQKCDEKRLNFLLEKGQKYILKYRTHVDEAASPIIWWRRWRWLQRHFRRRVWWRVSTHCWFQPAQATREQIGFSEQQCWLGNPRKSKPPCSTETFGSSNYIVWTSIQQWGYLIASWLGHFLYPSYFSCSGILNWQTNNGWPSKEWQFVAVSIISARYEEDNCSPDHSFIIDFSQI